MPGNGRVFQELQKSIDVTLASTPLNVVVMGPALSDESDAGRLRKGLIDAAREYGTTVQPEHRGVTEASELKLGAGHHLTAAELHLVDVSQVVVLIPASAGSLCELGFFSSLERCAAKMVILVNDEHPRKGSYVADGPIKAARLHGAQVEYVDYHDFEACWELVRTCIEEVRAKEGFKRLLTKD